jgi:lipopolysaccharide export system protein LptC
MSSPTDIKRAQRLQALSQNAVLRMRLARWVGPLAVLLGVLLFLFFLFQSGFFSLFQPVPMSNSAPVAVSPQMSGTNTVIHGFDKNGLGYAITSVTAVQDETNKDVAHLGSPTGVFERSTGGKLKLNSQTAIYNSKTKALNLEGQVVFEQQGRYKATMDKAALNVDTMDLSSQSPVHVELSNGSVDADHLEISENGKKTLFTGHVKANLKSDIKSEIAP